MLSGKLNEYQDNKLFYTLIPEFGGIIKWYLVFGN